MAEVSVLFYFIFFNSILIFPLSSPVLCPLGIIPSELASSPSEMTLYGAANELECEHSVFMSPPLLKPELLNYECEV